MKNKRLRIRKSSKTSGIKLIWICALFPMWIFNACEYNIEEELYPSVECQSQDMSYKEDIVPIIDQACLVCHSVEQNFANINFETYETILPYINSGQLLGSIKHESGYSPMPKNQSMLLECEISKIENWILDGSPNN